MREIATKLLQDKFPGTREMIGDHILDVTEYRGDITLVVKPESIRDVIRFLKDGKTMTPAFNILMDLFAVDYLKYREEMPERFAVVYNLYSLPKHERVFVKVWLPEAKPEVDSIHDLYQAVNWFEREAFDLYGIIFRGHPNLVRILTHAEFEGHPLRKDYPSDGYQRLKAAVPSSEL